ncbi:MAG: hypothetical protein JW821_20565 [Deltaproteobacteria bacterium]|nr:hypothetical protein [Deltaproteobacteria bacterium]
MEWIEMVHLRSYSQPDRDEALAAFHQLTLPDRESGLGDIVLFRDIALDNDLCLLIRWSDDIPGRGKSPLGLQLAAAFSAFGRINHSVWVHAGSVPLKARRIRHEEQI